MQSKDEIIKSWVSRYSEKLFTWAFYKTGDKNISEDLTQETFMAAFQSVDSFKGDSEPLTWLFSILKNKIAAYYRDKSRLYLESYDQLKASTDNYFDEEGNWKEDQRPIKWNEDNELLDNTEFLKTLANCISNLPESWNAALQLKYLKETNSQNICQELNISA
ncbi:MAG: sigma-70 family RNA polymerase sigma factor, partial [Bacteroidetes bacterium]|nr:sigma-70 family RNA polymerase sigma factor [Bacteroidota bacterium]